MSITANQEYIIISFEDERIRLAVDIGTVSQPIIFKHVPVITDHANIKVLSFRTQIINYYCLWGFLVEACSRKTESSLHSTIRTGRVCCCWLGERFFLITDRLPGHGWARSRCLLDGSQSYRKRHWMGLWHQCRWYKLQVNSRQLNSKQVLIYHHNRIKAQNGVFTSNGFMNQVSWNRMPLRYLTSLPQVTVTTDKNLKSQLWYFQPVGRYEVRAWLPFSYWI